MNESPVGILGGGQLARMLVEAARPLGITPVVLTSSTDDPAAQICGRTILGSPSDDAALARLFDEAGLVVFESEFVSRPTLERATRLASRPPRFAPSLAAIERVQSKLEQKKLFDELSIPTAAWRRVGADAVTPESLERFREGLEKAFPQGYVLKLAEGGYDGKGNWLGGGRDSFGRFLADAASRGTAVYAEARIGFRRELACVAVRSASGDWVSYPVVVSEQEKGICRKVYGPAESFGIRSDAIERVRQYSRSLGDRLDLVGAYAIECFETELGEVLLNEMAPRVHNSGHFTQDLCAASQFENHWRAVLGLPLGATQAREPCFGMWNSLASGPDRAGPQASGPLPSGHAWARLHGYGKKTGREGRKMGHWNLWAESREELERRFLAIQELDRRWLEGDWQPE